MDGYPRRIVYCRPITSIIKPDDCRNDNETISYR